jgi:conjugal transfer pilus assembly protein TraF
LAALVLIVGVIAAPGQSYAQDRHASASLAAYWEDSWRGWHFYEDPPPAVQTPKPIPAERVSPAKPTERRAPEVVLFERLQKRLEEYRQISIINPSEANVRRYMELEAQVVRQASLFSDVAQRVAWATPDLDMTLQGRPVNAQALEVFDRDQLAERGRTIATLARDHVLFFFFRGDCPYCHAFAPTMQAFEARYGLQVVPISMDGDGLPQFSDFRRDNGISQTLQVTQVPAVFLAQPYTGTITPIGFGVLSESQLLERIATVSTPASARLVPSLSRRLSLQ